MKATRDLLKYLKVVLTDPEAAYYEGDKILKMTEVAIMKKQKEYEESKN